MKDKIVVALAGNPNSGKTTIFNELTGARQHVGNYPGVTVEHKEGFCRYKGTEMKIIDLPGTYSLTAYSAEEVIARNFIIEEKPDVVVNILDASNLERNLYLTVQLMELGAPLVLVLNMTDTAKSRGYEIDVRKFSQLFGAHVVKTIGHKGKGIENLLEAIVETASKRSKANHIITDHINYGCEIEKEITKVKDLIEKHNLFTDKYSPRWLALKLLEKDKNIHEIVDSASPEVIKQVEESISRIEEILGESSETAIAGARYGFISEACQEMVRSTIEIKHTISDKIDTVVTNRVLGIPIFLGLMYLVFQLTFTLGDPLMGWIEEFFGWLAGWIESSWSSGSYELLKSFLIDGIIGGVGGVLVFLPNIMLLFLAIAILEDSGYMARAAFIMDRLMNKIGLHGKSFIPMLIGFGCTVPAIMATRTIENRRDRLVTMLVLPLISCGARLPIYTLIIPAFFPESQHGTILWSIYLIGIILAIIVAKLLRGTILKGESMPFVMELPPYRVPTLKGIFIHMWERCWLYLKKAGTIILGISILLWAMTTFPSLPENEVTQFEKARNQIVLANITDDEKTAELAAINNEELEASLSNSLAGRIGHAMEPVLKPMGFDWKIGTALIGAFAAKEVFVSQMGIIYSIGEADEESQTLRDKLRNTYTPLIGFCIMLFCLISAPCMATIAITKRESNSWRWALFQLGGLTILAYTLTTLVYQIGRLLGIGIS